MSEHDIPTVDRRPASMQLRLACGAPTRRRHPRMLLPRRCGLLCGRQAPAHTGGSTVPPQTWVWSRVGGHAGHTPMLGSARAGRVG